MNATAQNTTAKEFSVHPALIHSLILRQASGAPKALLELVMNSVDAGSTRIDIELTENGYVIADNGKGFKDKAQITDFFGTFGFPHSENDAFYGRFRLGRAQSFGISRSKWYSKDFCMAVDLKVDLDMDDKEAPLGYEVTEGHPFYQGCKIVGEFYNPQNIGSVLDFHKASLGERPEEMPIIPALIKMIRYLPCEVFINGEKVNLNAEECAVSHQTKTANFILTESKDGVVNVYNKGVYAYQIPSRYFSGDVVSIEALDLNIARNEAKYTCKIAKSIKSKLGALDRAMEHKEDDKPKEKPIKSLTGFIDSTWEMMLGMKPLNAESLLLDLKRKVIVCANDQKTSFYQVAKDIASQSHRIKTNDFEVVLFDSANLGNQEFDLDVMSVISGFIPKEMLPSKEIMDRLDYQVQTFPSHCYPSALDKKNIENVNYVKFHCFDFSSEDSYLEKCSKLLAFLISVCYALYYLDDQQDFSFAPFYVTSQGSYPSNFRLLGEHKLTVLELSDLPAEQLKTKIENQSDVDVKLNDFEKMVMAALSRSNSYPVLGRTRNLYVVKTNQVGLLAYTDGCSYINFNHEYLKNCINQGNFEGLMTTFIHEMSHGGKSLGVADHGATFFNEYMHAFAKVFHTMMISFYDELGSRIEKRVNSRGIDWLKQYNVPMAVVQKIGINRMNNKIRAFG